MGQWRIFVSNLGYARDIDGSAWQHVRRGHRHIYARTGAQRKALDAVHDLIAQHQPDICCFLEVDTGSWTSGGFNQFTYLANGQYPFRDAASKYTSARLTRSPWTRGKSNGFIAKQEMPFCRKYFSHGSKRLIYCLELSDRLTLFFTHLALKREVRVRQLHELRRMADENRALAGKYSVIAGDFNILAGLSELDILLGDGMYVLGNKRDDSSFRLFKRLYLLDVCIISAELAATTRVHMLPQPFSDHDALLIDVQDLPG